MTNFSFEINQQTEKRERERNSTGAKNEAQNFTTESFVVMLLCPATFVLAISQRLV